MRHAQQAMAKTNRLSLAFSLKVIGMTIAVLVLKFNDLLIEIT